MILFLALRNIIKNKKNSALIVLFIAIITFLFFIGNSIIEKSDRSLKETYIESLTGDVVLEKTSEISMNLFGANAPIINTYISVPLFPAYDTVMEIMKNEDGIAGITSQVSGRAAMRIRRNENGVLLCGIDAESYFTLLSGIKLERGRFLKPGEYGAMITMDRLNRIQGETNRKISIGSPVTFTNGGYVGFKIREVPLVGVFSYKNPGLFMNDIVIIDPQTVRKLNSIQLAGSSDIELGQDLLDVLNADIDDLFGDQFSSGEYMEDDAFSIDFLRDFLKESAPIENYAETGGDWNFIIIKLKDGVSPKSFISSINKKLEPYGISAVDWRTAAGTSAILLLLVRALFNIGVFLVAVAGVIAAINVLLISVFRRTREIGTLRTIGASDGYIRLLIYSENIIITLIAGFLGISGGALFFKWIKNHNIFINNSLIVSLLGGAELNFEFLPHIAAMSFAAAILLGFAASLYPVEMAVRIEPMAAVRKG